MIHPIWPGALVISLDFELNWGVRDRSAPERYRHNVLGVREAVPALLDMFAKYTIRATWATVGFLFCRTRNELLAAAPRIRPHYHDERLCPYRSMEGVGASEGTDLFHYAPSLIALIAKYPDQEIATHTFSHYYCLEPGQDVSSFEADLKAAIAVAKRENIPITSLVFPRNQVNERYLASCAQLGITAYRGNLQHSMFSFAGRSIPSKLFRLADTYIRLSGDNSFLPAPSIVPVNIPGSRFLRPYNRRSAMFENWRMRRICRDLTSAAEKGRVYHLWWHPHNFGVNLRENLSFLEGVLRHFEKLRKTYGMESLTMAGCASNLTRRTHPGTG